jgi:hypothetical protein
VNCFDRNPRFLHDFGLFWAYHRDEIAEAEPAVPGWTFPVDDLWEQEE